MQEGRVKLYRKALDNCIWSNIELIWLLSYILMQASHTKKEFMLWLQKKKILPWQFISSQKKIAEKFLLSRSKINRLLKVLGSEWIVKHEWNTKYTLFTIINRHKYQWSETQANIKWTSSGHQVDTIKNVKNIKNEKNIYNIKEKIEKENLSDFLQSYELEKFINYRSETIQRWKFKWKEKWISEKTRDTKKRMQTRARNKKTDFWRKEDPNKKEWKREDKTVEEREKLYNEYELKYWRSWPFRDKYSSDITTKIKSILHSIW